MHMHRHTFKRPIPLVEATEETGGAAAKPTTTHKSTELTAKWTVEEGKLVCHWVQG